MVVRLIPRYDVFAIKAHRVMAGKIFINYRRDDSISTAGRLHDRLAQAFGRDSLFMDVDHVPAGVDFVEYLHKQVAACDVFLAVIGPNWLNAKDEGGRRFDNPEDDFVTIEIAAALARKEIRVIPVLVDGARIPKADKLPLSIEPLVRRNAVEIRNTHFGRDAEALVDKISETFQGTQTTEHLVDTPRPSWKVEYAVWIVIGIGALLAIISLLSRSVIDFIVAAGATGAGYWLIYCKLHGDVTVAKIVSLVLACVTGYFILVNIALQNIFFATVEVISATCLVYVFIELSRLSARNPTAQKKRS